MPGFFGPTNHSLNVRFTPESSPSKTTKLSDLNDRFREKLPFKIESGNIIDPVLGERPLYPRKQPLSYY